MEIREGMKFTIHNLLYSIFSIEEKKVEFSVFNLCPEKMIKYIEEKTFTLEVIR